MNHSFLTTPFQRIVFLFLVIVGILALFAFFPTGPEDEQSSGAYHLSQLRDDEWQEVHRDTFRVEYETRDYVFEPVDQALQVRIVHRGGDFSDVEQVKLMACGSELEPEYARYADSGDDVLADVLEQDHNVVIAQDKDIELSWVLPESCAEPVTLSLTANAYGHAFPFLFTSSAEEKVSYELDSNRGALTVDGLLTETDGKEEALYSPLWQPVTGHPDGNTYIYVRNDDEYVYFSIDVTMDNTDEIGEDFAEIEIGRRIFRITDEDTTYGTCAFGSTSKAAYKHQTCELAIPREAFSGDQVEFSLRYYGTGGG